MDIRLIEPLGLKVLIADSDPQSASLLAKMLASQGYSIIGSTTDPASLIEICQSSSPDVLVIHAGDLEGHYLAAINAMPVDLRCPTVMLSSRGEPADIKQAIAAGVNAYFLVGVNGNRIRAGIDTAIANFTNLAFLRKERDAALAALEDRKVVERAKGITMRQKQLGEHDAYELLRRRAMDRGMRLIEVARMITAAEDLLA